MLHIDKIEEFDKILDLLDGYKMQKYIITHVGRRY